MRTQFKNRKYETKYNNETYNFFKSLNPEGMFKDTASALGVSYVALHLSFKSNRISHSMMKKIERVFTLNEDQKNILNSLVLK